MARLNQILAVEQGTKTRTHTELTEVHQGLQKVALLEGLSRTYQPNDEGGEVLPSEVKKVQVTVNDSLTKVRKGLAALFDITATKDFTNCIAKADVVVNGKVLVSQAPATYLLFLEKQLVDLHTLIKKLPVLDPAETWHFDGAKNVFATDTVKTIRSKKVPRNHVKAPATDKFPAQVELWHEDVSVGVWNTVKFSGALPANEVSAMLERVEKLQSAVKFAREEANNVTIVETKTGDALLDFVLKG